MLAADPTGGIARLAVDLVPEVTDAPAAVALLAFVKRSVTFVAVAHSKVLSSDWGGAFVGNSIRIARSSLRH